MLMWQEGRGIAPTHHSGADSSICPCCSGISSRACHRSTVACRTSRCEQCWRLSPQRGGSGSKAERKGAEASASSARDGDQSRACK